MCLIIGFEIIMRSYENLLIEKLIMPASKSKEWTTPKNLCSYKIKFHQIKKHTYFMLFHTLLVKIKLEKDWFLLQSLQYLVVVVSRLFLSPEELAPVFRQGDWSRPRVEGLLCHLEKSPWYPLHSPPAPSHVHKVCRFSADDNPFKEHRSFTTSTWEKVYM